MANLFVGLFDGNRLLDPLAGDVVDLNYRLFALEPEYMSLSGRCNPDAIACSPTEAHSLIAEWTAHPFCDRKHGQLRRFILTSPDELISNAAVPRPDGESVSTWVVVQPDFARDFEVVLPDPVVGCLISTVRVDDSGEVTLNFYAGELGSEALSKLLSTHYNFQKIPRGYIPFTLDNLSLKSLADPVIQQLVAYAAKGKVVFNENEFCSELIPSWDSISMTKRKEISKAVRRVIQALIKKDYIEKWLSRVSHEPATWKFALPTPQSLQSMVKRIQRALSRFRDEQFAPDPFPGLFDHLD